jgi:hypothetical protein
MQDVGFRQMLAHDRFEELRRAAFHAPRRVGTTPRAEAPDVELRLCKPGDDPELERLAALSERPLPLGRLVLALVEGRIVAALPVAGGCAIRDPFVKTHHLVRLLELRAAQLRPATPRGGAMRLLRKHA